MQAWFLKKQCLKNHKIGSNFFFYTRGWVVSMKNRCISSKYIKKVPLELITFSTPEQSCQKTAIFSIFSKILMKFLQEIAWYIYQKLRIFIAHKKKNTRHLKFFHPRTKVSEILIFFYNFARILIKILLK